MANAQIIMTLCIIREIIEYVLIQLIFRACQVESNGDGHTGEPPRCDDSITTGDWADT
jgi:hypothetical protein